MSAESFVSPLNFVAFLIHRQVNNSRFYFFDESLDGNIRAGAARFINLISPTFSSSHLSKSEAKFVAMVSDVL